MRLLSDEGDNEELEVYKHPLYYEIAHGFFDVRKQVDMFEAIIKKFSKIKVKRFLDVACGPSLQLREIVRRGYEGVGLDVAPEMLRYLAREMGEEGRRVETVQADMSSFRLKRKVDFAFIMMGSLVFVSNEKFLDHLDSLASCLKKGGLYFIQNKMVNWTGNVEQSWTEERDGVKVKTTFSMHWKDIVGQLYTEKMKFEVNDQGKTCQFVSEEDLKFVFPQEFKLLVRFNDKFEFLGWWEGTESTWFLDKPLDKSSRPSNINMTLLRRK